MHKRFRLDFRILTDNDTITFSTILVVLTTYLSEFSPRTLQNFITDYKTQRVLGIFVGGFIYSILLLLLRETNTITRFIVPAIAVFISIVCLLVFVFFINHVTRWTPWEDWESDEIKHLPPKHFNLNKAGYIQYIDIDGLLKKGH